MNKNNTKLMQVVLEPQKGEYIVTDGVFAKVYSPRLSKKSALIFPSHLKQFLNNCRHYEVFINKSIGKRFYLCHQSKNQKND